MANRDRRRRRDDDDDVIVMMMPMVMALINNGHQLTHVMTKPSGGAPAGPLRAGRPCGRLKLVASLEASTTATATVDCCVRRPLLLAVPVLPLSDR